MKKTYLILSLLLAFTTSSFLLGQSDCLTLKAGHLTASSGTSICVNVVAEPFDDLIGMQFSLQWDTAIISFEEVNNFDLLNLTSGNFGLPEVIGDPGRLTFFWAPIDGRPISLLQKAVLFSICFEVIGDNGESSRIDFDNSPTALEFIAGAPTSFNLKAASLLSGSVTVGTTDPGLPTVVSTLCPQATNCSEVPPAGIQTATSGGTPPYSYTWTGPNEFTANEPDVNDILPGTYRVVVYDSMGLTNSILFYVPGTPPISLTNINITPPDSCNTQNGGAIGFDMEGGSGAYEYLWSDGSESAGRTDLPAGIYELTVTDQLLGCSAVESFTISTVSSNQVKAAVITPVSCGTSNTGAISLELTGAPENISLLWNTGDTTPEITNLSPGTYSASITDASGCVTSWTGQIKASDQVAFGGTIGYDNCNQGSGFITLEMPSAPSEYTYAWSNGETTKDISDLAVGTYRVTVTHTDSVCTGIKNFYVKDDALVTASAWECTAIDEQTVFAKVSTVVWSGGTPPYQFTWSNGDSMTDDMIGTTTVSLPATLGLTITDAQGCVTLVNSITPDCSNGGPTFTTASSYDCINGDDGNPDYVKIDYFVWDGGSPPYTFSWSTGETFTHNRQSSIIVPADSLNSYTVTVTDQLSQTHVSDPISPVCLSGNGIVTLDIEENIVSPGDPICLPVSVQGFDNIAGLQFSISWDPTQLRGDSLIQPALPNFGAGNYSFGPFIDHPSEGAMTFSWIDSQGLGRDLADDISLFEICFTAIGNRDSVDVIFSNDPTIVEATTGDLEVIPVSTRKGAIYIQADGIPKVWPGDTDNNGLVDHFDLLNIGLAFDANGYPRPDPKLNWEAQFAAPWGQTTPNTQIDFRHVDTDGNGTVNALDTLALALNYQLFNEDWNGEDGYTQRENLPESARTTGTPIFVDTYPVEEGTSPVFDIVLGDADYPENTVYGLAFSIDYDPLAIVPGSINLSFTDSWLGAEGQDMLTFYRIDSQDHRIHVAMTRTDGLDITGSGAIAQLLVTIEDVIFRSNDYDIPISIKNARLITSMEEAVPVAERSSTITVSTTTKTLDPALDHQIRVYPVPAKEVLFLKAPQLRIEIIELFDLEGRRLQSWRGHPERLPLVNLPQGTYVLRLITDQGVAVRSILIMN